MLKFSFKREINERNTSNIQINLFNTLNSIKYFIMCYIYMLQIDWPYFIKQFFAIWPIFFGSLI